MARQRRPHWLTGAGFGTTPPVTVCFDTETSSVTRDGSEVMTLRCWDAILRVRDAQRPLRTATHHHQGESAGELALLLEAATEAQGEAWCFAHNLGFDLTVTCLPMILAARDWEPRFVNIGDETCVFVLGRDSERLVITDSWSWLRCGLQAAGKDIGMRQARLPDGPAGLEAWHRRCRHDAEILDGLIAELLTWWDSQGLGKFAITGAACGWRTLRAKVEPRAVLVGAEQPRTSLERDAIYGGRREVWQVGQVTGRWVEDWDLRAAHLTTVASLPLPARPIDARRFHAPISPLEPPGDVGALCTVEIACSAPCAPVRVGDDVWWPVGRFRTTLTSVELARVHEIADSVQVLDAQLYELSMALAPWAQWCEDLQTGAGGHVPKVVRRVAKGWGRSVPGRFAMRTSSLVGERAAGHLGWALETGQDLDTGEPLEIVTYGGVERTYRKDVDGQDCSPVVLAFVEGYVRAAMSRILAARPPDRLLQCNTDGWWEVRGGRDTAAAGLAAPAPYTAVRAAVSNDVRVIGPNHLEAPGHGRLAGIPNSAERAMDGSYRWQDWPGLRWQLQNSRPGEYIRPGRALRLQPHYCRRWVLTSGETVPVSCELDSSGCTVILPWSRTACRQPSDELAEHQVPALAALRDDGPCVAGPYPSGASRLPGRRAPG